MFIDGYTVKETMKLYKKPLIVFTTPVILSLFLLFENKKLMKFIYSLLLLLVYWMTDALPIAVTSIIPCFLFPVLGMVNTKDIMGCYMNEDIILVIAVETMAVAVQYWGVHRRIGLLFMILTGMKPRLILFVTMILTWFLSMYSNGIALTAGMMPIVDAMLDEAKYLMETEGLEDDLELCGLVDISSRSDPKIDKDYIETYIDKLGKALSLAIAYSACIGGFTTLSGSYTTFILQAHMRNYATNFYFSYFPWVLYAIPISFMCLVLTWMCLQIVFIGIRELFTFDFNTAKHVYTKRKMADKLTSLGPLTFPQGSVLFLYLFLYVAWLSEYPADPGWMRWFTRGKREYVSTATVSFLVSSFLFVWPTRNPFAGIPDSSAGQTDLLNRSDYDVGNNEEMETKKSRYLLDLVDVAYKYPWNTIFFLGGRRALAALAKNAELMEIASSKLEGMRHFPWGIQVAIVIITTSSLADVIGSDITAFLMIPMVDNVGRCIRTNPTSFMIPCAIASSIAFALPIGSAMSAVAFGHGLLTMWDMIKIGMLFKILGTLVVLLATITYGDKFFGLSTFPDWAGPCERVNKSAL